MTEMQVWYAVAGIAGLFIACGSYLMGIWTGIAWLKRVQKEHGIDPDGSGPGGGGPGGPGETLPNVAPRRLQAVRTERELDPDYDPRRTFNPSQHDTYIRRRLEALERGATITDRRAG